MLITVFLNLGRLINIDHHISEFDLLAELGLLDYQISEFRLID